MHQMGIRRRLPARVIESTLSRGVSVFPLTNPGVVKNENFYVI